MLKQNLKKLLPPVILSFLKKLKYQLDFLPYSKLVTKNHFFKNKHIGERCFILGSGPSVSLEDLEPLRNEVLIALNSFYIHDKYSKIFDNREDKYHLIAPIHDPQSEETWEKWFEELQSNIPKSVNIFFGLNNRKPSSKELIDRNKLFEDRNINWFFSTMNKDNEDLSPSEIDFTKNILSSSTSSVWALQLAIYMGFKEIYLIGMDHNYIALDKNKQRFAHSSYLHIDEQKLSDASKVNKETLSSLYSMNTETLFHTAKIFMHYKKIKNVFKGDIYNLSKDSFLDIFEYRSLKEVLEQDEVS